MGLSVRDNCPECGTAVRAAILHAVDPLAEELAPMRAPSLTGVLIVVWAIAGALGIWLIVLMRLMDGLRAINLRVPSLWWGWDVAFVLLVISAVATFGFLMPTKRTRRRNVLCALGAMLAYAPFFYSMHRIRMIDAAQGGVASYFTDMPEPARIGWRIVIGLCLIAIFLGVRPNARELVRRSLAMRTGRVDRQTLLAMVLATGIMIIGDLVRLWGASGGGSTIVIFGSLLILIATVFLGVGMTAAVVDGARIRRSLRMGPRRMQDLIGPQLGSGEASEAHD